MPKLSFSLSIPSSYLPYLVGAVHFPSTFTTAVAATAGKLSAEPHFMVDYLVASCGLSPEKAVEASKSLRRIKSCQQPDSVLDFFKKHGFDETHLKKLVSWYPRWLAFNVEKTLAPKFRALHDLGFTGPDLTHIVMSNPVVINHNLHHVVSKIQVWRDLLGSDEHLKKFLKGNQWLFSSSIEKTIQPNLSVLKDCGISDQRITLVLKKHPKFIIQKPDALRALIDRAKGLGVLPGSATFHWALWVLYRVGQEKFNAKLEAMRGFGWSEAVFLAAFRKAPGFLTGSVSTMREKMELMKSLGWSDSEFLSVCQKAPAFLGNSVKTMQIKMEFLVKEAGCEPSYMARYPQLLMMSLEKRLVPRYHVMEMMKSKGLHGGTFQLATIMKLSEKDFIEKFVLCHKETAPELLDMYVSLSCKGAPL